jgi:TIR domain/NACHT domain
MKELAAGRPPITVFFSYAHADEAACQRLLEHLSHLQQEGTIASWHDRLIDAGTNWAQAIDQAINSASIILLLVSPNFLISDYCYDVEMKIALERQARGEARVIPIILRPCDWTSAPFAHLQCLPRNRKPVSTWEHQDEAFAVIVEELRRTIRRLHQSPAMPPFSKIEMQNRTRLSKRVRQTWIAGVLENSLHHAARLALNLHNQPDALANPWHLEVQETYLAARPFPQDIPVERHYDEADGELLILGEPGAGKTTLLLELALTLIERAEREKQPRMPVIFNLSSWAIKRSSLANWLMEELRVKYYVPERVAQAWIDARQIIPLLDGLDEMPEDVRSLCVQAINDYQEESLLAQEIAPLVVCCRIQEYMAQPTRVKLLRAVAIQPLTYEQVEYYLQNAGGHLEGLQHALRQEPDLFNFVCNPLMLSIFTLAYQDAAVQDVMRQGSYEAQQRQVFATYVERMLVRRGVDTHYTREQTLHWLTRLARQLVQHNQTEFYLERMQPTYLTERPARLRLYRVVVKVSIVLLSALLATVIVAVLNIVVLRVTDLLTIGVASDISNYISGIILGALIGLLAGVVVGLLRKVERHIVPAEVVIWSWSAMWQRLFKSTALKCALLNGSIAALLLGGSSAYLVGRDFALLSGMLAAISVGPTNGLVIAIVRDLLAGGPERQQHTLSGRWHRAWKKLLSGLIGGLVAGILNGLLIALVLALTAGFSVAFPLLIGLLSAIIACLTIVCTRVIKIEKKPVEMVIWLWINTWRKIVMGRALRNGLLVAFLTGLLLAPFVRLDGGILFAVILFPSCWLISEVVDDLIRGLSSNLVDKRALIRPNQGIYNSARNSLFVGFVGGSFFGLGVGPLIGLAFALLMGSHVLLVASTIGLFVALVAGLTTGLSIGLANGGAACIQYIVLRVFLWLAGYAPLGYVRFLDYAAERILLRKVGGGYIFAHRLLLDYFVSLDAPGASASIDSHPVTPVPQQETM